VSEILSQMYTHYYVKCPLFLSVLMKLEFSRWIFVKHPNIKFHEISFQWEAELFHVDRRTDMTKLIIAFSQFCKRA